MNFNQELMQNQQLMLEFSIWGENRTQYQGNPDIFNKELNSRTF
jgi:hypothetical protein